MYTEHIENPIEPHTKTKCSFDVSPQTTKLAATACRDMWSLKVARVAASADAEVARPRWYLGGVVALAKVLGSVPGELENAIMEAPTGRHNRGLRMAEEATLVSGHAPTDDLHGMACQIGGCVTPSQ